MMDTTKLLCDILIYVPIAFLSLYVTVYLTLKYSFYNPTEERRDVIRRNIAAKWVQDHKDFLAIIDNVPVKYIRVLVKPTKNEDRGFRTMQVVFCVLSIALFLFGILANRMEERQTLEYILLAGISTYCAALTAILFKTYYELKFFQLLDTLYKESNSSGLSQSSAAHHLH